MQIQNNIGVIKKRTHLNENLNFIPELKLEMLYWQLNKIIKLKYLNN